MSAKTWLQCYWIALAVILSGCNAEPVSVAQTDNAEIRVARLFDHDGCTVYRFHDGGRDRYFVKCAEGNDRAESDDTEPCGKTPCPRPEVIETAKAAKR